MCKIALIAMALLVAPAAQAFEPVVTFQRAPLSPAQAAPIAEQFALFAGGSCTDLAVYNAPDVVAADCGAYWLVSNAAGEFWTVPSNGLEDALSDVYQQPAKIVEETDSSFTIHLP